MQPEIQKAIEESIKEERPIKVSAYAVIPETEAVLSFITESILKRYDKMDMLGPTYTAAKELALNGAKANIKRVLFQELEIDMEDDESYDEGMLIFKKNLTEEWAYSYAEKCFDQQLKVDIVFDFNSERLIIEVINNRPISKREDTRIRQKFTKAMQYEDIAMFYMEGGDSSEGAGMGIVLVTMMLKAQGFDPHLFTIRSNYHSSTIAKVEFPISDNYLSSRERYEKKLSSEKASS